MLTKRLSYLLLPLLALGDCLGSSGPQLPAKVPDRPSGTLERLIVASGTVAMELDLNRLTGRAPRRRDRIGRAFVSKCVQILSSPSASLTKCCAEPNRDRWS